MWEIIPYLTNNGKNEQTKKFIEWDVQFLIGKEWGAIL